MPSSVVQNFGASFRESGRSLMRGVLEIYGTSNCLTAAYSMLCGALCLAGALGYLIAAQKMM